MGLFLSLLHSGHERSCFAPPHTPCGDVLPCHRLKARELTGHGLKPPKLGQSKLFILLNSISDIFIVMENWLMHPLNN
jgi:hypothetical protein